MATYEVVLTLPENGEEIFRTEVEADDSDEAASLVLENFKTDHRVTDSQSWNVHVRLLR